MSSPFRFGKIVHGTAFINRTNDIRRLSSNIESKINTIIISPRRWGKSSLVEKVVERFNKDKNYRVCFIDLFNVRTEDEFYKLFATQLIKSSSGKWEEWLQDAKTFLSKLSPKISMQIDDIADIDIQFELKKDALTALEILDLPEKIAKTKKINLIVCLDEFQNIDNFNDPVGFQQKLRAQWQKHKRTVYCLYGSKRHLLMQLFEKKAMPFYRFGDTIYLKKIEKGHFVKFIVKKFQKANKIISEETAGQLVDAMQCHPDYVQQLAHIIWNNCDQEVTKKVFEKSLEDLIYNNITLFQREFENLSNAQINFLKLLSEGIRTGFTKNEIIRKYNLGSSSNVIYIINALENKEIIDRMGEKLEFIDPVFERWLKMIL